MTPGDAWTVAGALGGVLVIIDGVLKKFGTLKKLWGWGKRAVALPGVVTRLETRVAELEAAARKPRGVDYRRWSGVDWVRSKTTGLAEPYCMLCHAERASWIALDVTENRAGMVCVSCPSEFHGFPPERSFERAAYEGAQRHIFDADSASKFA